MIVKSLIRLRRWLRARRFARRRNYWRKKYQKEMLKHERLLMETAGRYRAIVETAVDAIIVCDAFGTLQSLNRAAEKIFGYEAREVSDRMSGR